MISLPPPCPDQEVLRKEVHARLAEIGHLEVGAFPMTERAVIRGGKTCGYYFCLHGPRSVKLTAVCDLQRRRVWFYGSDGQRVAHATLREQPHLSHSLPQRAAA